MAEWLELATREMWLTLITYFPLGVIGIWRWGVWLVKKAMAATYQPASGEYASQVAVVTPVYNENPEIFRQAVESWRQNEVDEIIAVIDYTDEQNIAAFRTFLKSFPGAKLIITEKPGKRPALVDGIQAARSEIIALVDSDTIWGKNVKKNSLIPFRNSKIGGVSTRQRVLAPQTPAQRIFNAQLNLRYLEELPFLVAAGGKVITCISGRTAFYRRAAVVPLLPELLHETFWGKPVISGDDKRLTYLIEASGWQVAFQQNALVYTPGAKDLKTFLRQRLRWTRNSWRADMRTLTQAWVYKHPRFVWYLTDRVLQPFAQLLSPIAFLVSLALGLWIPAAVLFVWWHLGRIIRMWPHLKRRPQDLKLIPVFIALNFYNALVKIYALITLNRQGWITRWSKERLPGPPPWLRTAAAYGVTGFVVSGMTALMATHEVNATYLVQRALLAEQLRPASVLQQDFSGSAPAEFRRHVVRSGETIAEIARLYDVPVDRLRSFNEALLPSLTHVEVGLALTIPPPDAPMRSEAAYSSEYQQLGPLRVTYLPETNTLEVRGRGQQVTLTRLRRLAEERFIREVVPGEWEIEANIVLKAGVSLRLSRDEITWLKLVSTPEKFASLTAEDGQILIEGVRITSWDAKEQSVDTNVTDGRSYLAVKGHARMDIFDSELAYLGYETKSAVATYGVSWFVGDAERGLVAAVGDVARSNLHHNFHGLYISGTQGVKIAESVLHDNRGYGVDVYGGSRQIRVSDNRIYRNGQHGIVLAQDADHNLLAGNLVLSNQQHGIILHEGSDYNRVEKNRVEGNSDGIVLQRSESNLVRENTILRHGRGVRVTGASNNQLQGNRIVDSHQAGIYLDTKSGEITYGDDNTLLGNNQARRVHVDII